MKNNKRRIGGSIIRIKWNHKRHTEYSQFNLFYSNLFFLLFFFVNKRYKNKQIVRKTLYRNSHTVFIIITKMKVE